MIAKSPKRPTALEIALRGCSEHRQPGKSARRHEERSGDRRRGVNEKERRERDAGQGGVREEHERRGGGADPDGHRAERHDEPELREEEPVKQDPVLQDRLDEGRRVGDPQRDDARRRESERHPSIGDPERVADAALTGCGERSSACVFHGREVKRCPTSRKGSTRRFHMSSAALAAAISKRPKRLLCFHRGHGEPRLPVSEVQHLPEGARLARRPRREVHEERSRSRSAFLSRSSRSSTGDRGCPSAGSSTRRARATGPATSRTD